MHEFRNSAFARKKKKKKDTETSNAFVHGQRINGVSPNSNTFQTFKYLAHLEFRYPVCLGFKYIFLAPV